MKNTFLSLLIFLLGVGMMIFSSGLENLQAKENINFLSEIKTYQLPSGLKVLFYPFSRERVVTVKICVKVGSNYEWEEVAGITHLIEHMIFKGTENLKPEDISGAVEAAGGYINAYTSYDYTCYYVSGPTEVFDTALKVLSEAVFHPLFDPLELEREKEVVVEEMKMRLDNPFILLYEELMKNSYTVYPYRRLIIGYEQSVRSLTRDDLFYFVNHFYTSKNMVLIIVGNLTEAEVLKGCERYFQNLPERKLKQVSFPEEPYRSTPKLVWVERPLKEGYFAFSLPGPSIKDEDAPLADLLTGILGGGQSSRLYQRLKRELNLVKSISADAFTPAGPGLIEIIGLAEPQNFKAILRETLMELLRLKKFGVSKEELERVKNKIFSDLVYTQETADGLARTIASFELTRGSFEDLNWYLKKIKETTPDDIMEYAKKTLHLNRLTAVFLSEKSLFSEEELNKILAELNLEEVEKFKLQNGLKVILYPQRDLPTIGFALIFPGGTRFETKETNGLFQALSLLWTRGTKKRSAEEIVKILEDLGAKVVGFTGRNTFGLKVLTLTENLDKTLEIFSEILLEPTFSQEECDKARPELFSLLYRQEDQPFALAIKELLELIFPDHSYGRNQAGSQDFYQKFSSQDLLGAYQRYVNPKVGTLVVVGNFNTQEMKLKLKKYLENWIGAPYEVDEEKAPNLPQAFKKIKNKKTFQTQILLAFPLPGLLSEERVGIEVLNSALSGMESRLFRILRDERSLAYAVSSFLVLYPKASLLIFYLSCSPEKKEEAIRGFYEILETLQKEGLTEVELARAKKRLLGRYRLSRQSNLAKAEDMAINQVLGLGWNYSERLESLVKQVTPEKIKGLIKDYLRPDRAYLYILGPDK